MPAVELIYDRDCPNVDAAREQLRQAFALANLPAHWKEWDSANPSGPPYARRYGSPTILIDGLDLAGQSPQDSSASCRVYTSPTGAVAGVPTAHVIASAITRRVQKRSGWRGALAVLPAFGASVLPVGVCPACWPVYAGLLSSLGLGFLLNATYLLPLTAAFLAVAVFSLAYGAQSRHGYRPLAVGAFGALTALVGKFALSSDLVLYAGLSLLVAASFWNSWPRRAAPIGSCAACAPQNQQAN